MKLKNKISWLMGRVQGSLFSHLNNCMDTALTEQEKRLVTILEFVQAEKGMSRRKRQPSGLAVGFLNVNL